MDLKSYSRPKIKIYMETLNAYELRARAMKSKLSIMNLNIAYSAETNWWVNITKYV